MITQSIDNPLCGSLLQLLPEAAGALGRFRLDQQMKVLGHQNPADQQKARLLPKLPQNLNEVATETVTIEELRATIGAGSEKLQLPGFKMASVHGHDDYSIRPWTGWKLAEAQSCALRQPAVASSHNRSMSQVCIAPDYTPFWAR